MGAIDRIFRGRRGGQDRPLAAQIAALFAAGEQGLWYDIESFRDAWNNVGPERLTNASFDDGLTSWTVTQPAGSTISAAGGNVTIVSDGASYAAITQYNVMEVGKLYIVTIELASASGTGKIVGIDTEVAFTGSKTFVGRATLTQIAIARQAAMAMVISRVSVREWLGLPSCALYQDAGGSLPTYMPGQGQVDPPVGLLLDKRFGIVRGSERFNETAVLFSGESYRVSPGVYRCYSSSGAYNLINLGGSLAVGKWYELTFTVDSVAVAGQGISLEGGDTTQTAFVATTVGVKRCIFRAAAAYIGIKRNAGAMDYQVSGVSIRELSGNHAYQATTASRPTLSARYNQLNNTNWSGAATGTPGTPPTGWTMNFGTASITAVTAVGADYAIQFTAAGTRSFLSQTFTVAANTTYSIAVDVVENSGTVAAVQIISLTGLPSGATTQFYLNGLAFDQNSVPPPGSRLELRLFVGATAGTISPRYGIGTAFNVTGVVTISRPDLRFAGDGVNLPPYQRVVDASTYDTAGFPLYLRSDGVDDGMALSSIDLSAYDSLFVCIAARKTSDAAAAMLMELSAAAPSNPGLFSIAAPESAAVAEWKVRMRGSTASGAVASAVAAPDSAVISATIELNAPRLVMRRNGAQQGFNSSAIGAGNFGVYPLYLFRRAGSSLPFGGKFFGALLRAGAANYGQIAKVEKYLNQKARGF